MWADSAAVGALLGAALAGGLLLLLAWLKTLRGPRLAERTLHAMGLEQSQRGQSPGPLTVLLMLITPAGLREKHTSRWSAERLAWVGAGIGIGALVALVLIFAGETPLLIVVLPALAGVVAVLLHKQIEAKRLRSIRAEFSAQLPGVAELLAFAVAAGEPLVPALDRVGRITGGLLGVALRECVADIRSGATVEDALRSLARSTTSPDVERFVDRITISLERGTPVADVLRAQAADARSHQRNALIEAAGRKDVAMLVPVVFLILPTVVVIALFPGMRAMQMFS
jgi:tight adherence protein C